MKLRGLVRIAGLFCGALLAVLAVAVRPAAADLSVGVINSDLTGASTTTGLLTAIGIPFVQIPLANLGTTDLLWPVISHIVTQYFGHWRPSVGKHTVYARSTQGFSTSAPTSVTVNVTR